MSGFNWSLIMIPLSQPLTLAVSFVLDQQNDGATLEPVFLAEGQFSGCKNAKEREQHVPFNVWFHTFRCLNVCECVYVREMNVLLVLNAFHLNAKASSVP